LFGRSITSLFRRIPPFLTFLLPCEDGTALFLKGDKSWWRFSFEKDEQQQECRLFFCRCKKQKDRVEEGKKDSVSPAGWKTVSG
jgi:hypothetical protein